MYNTRLFICYIEASMISTPAPIVFFITCGYLSYHIFKVHIVSKQLYRKSRCQWL